MSFATPLAWVAACGGGRGGGGLHSTEAACKAWTGHPKTLRANIKPRRPIEAVTPSLTKAHEGGSVAPSQKTIGEINSQPLALYEAASSQGSILCVKSPRVGPHGLERAPLNTSRNALAVRQCLPPQPTREPSLASYRPLPQTGQPARPYLDKNLCGVP